MAKTGSSDAVSPYDSANFLEHITFGYGLPMMRAGASRPLQHEDLPAIGEGDSTALLVQRVLDAWQAEVQCRPSSPSLWRALYAAFRRKFWLSGFFALLESSLRVAQALLLKFFLQAMLIGEMARCYSFAGGLVVACFLQAAVHHQLFFITMTGGWNIRIGISGVLHWKLLRIQTCALQADSAMDCSNLVANDVQRFDTFMPFMHFVWAAWMDLLMVGALLVAFVGWVPTLVGIACVLVFVIIMIQFASRFASRRAITAAITDERLKRTSEIISAILSVKVYCWEDAFTERIAAIRQREHASIFKRQLMVAATSTIYFTLLPMASLALFLALVLRDGRLELDTVYTVLGLLMVLRTSFGKGFKMGVQFGPECHAAVQRLKRFLLLPEVSMKPRQQLGADAQREEVLRLEEASYVWTGTGLPALAGLGAGLRKGELLVVCGPVGCGKSALLQALLGDLRLVAGGATLRGSVAYAPQAPWVMAGTVRSNVLLGAKEEPAWYEEVIRACSLDEDVQQLGPLGHDTEIGERGVNLSGGQKARLGLARAVYARTDVVLLDDPLSAVDPRVAAQLVHGCIRGKVLESAAVVLCTHHEGVIPLADAVLVLDDDGAMRAFGTPKDVAAKCGMALASPIPAPRRDQVAAARVAEAPSKAAKAPAPEAATTLVKAEDKHKGSVGLRTYWHYIISGGVGLSAIMLVTFVLSQVTLLASNYWMGIWAAAADQEDESYVNVFAGLTVATVVLASLRSVLFYSANLRASSSVHSAALRSVVGTRLAFFTENPHGRVLNRFSGDLGNIDELLSQALHEVLDLGCTGAGTMALVCITVPPVIPAFFLMFCYMARLRTFVVKSMTELKRLDSVSKSPIVDTFAASLRGIVCLRAFGREDAAQRQMVGHLDRNAQAWFWWLITNRFLGFRLDLQVVVIMACSTFGGALLRSIIKPELIGLAVVHVISLSGLFQFMVRQSAQVESYMTSFERLRAYAALPGEPEAAIAGPPAGFPRAGAVSVEGLWMRYREDLPTVLRGVDFSCPGGVKVGLCGRTGSGKSSIFMALARLTETTQGKIAIDGVDISTLPLKTLRRCISWVPQEPSFFSGSLRSNLDPFGEYTDKQVWDALKAVHMAEAAGAEGLAFQIAEQGCNFSAGERQLLSLARALLQRRRLICMDEAFANVDFETDAKVQLAIRAMTEGVGATVFVIAHRMKSLADCDYIVVMEAGAVREHGPPQDLLQRPGGAFAAMVGQASAQGAGGGAPAVAATAAAAAGPGAGEKELPCGCGLVKLLDKL